MCLLGQYGSQFHERLNDAGRGDTAGFDVQRRRNDNVRAGDRLGYLTAATGRRNNEQENDGIFAVSEDDLERIRTAEMNGLQIAYRHKQSGELTQKDYEVKTKANKKLAGKPFNVSFKPEREKPDRQLRSESG